MKKNTVILLAFIAFAVVGQAQCTLENIFPVKHGFSKFKVTTTISTIKNIKEDQKANELSGIFNRWYQPPYLKGDSVFKSSISYDYLSHDCFKGDENVMFLHFVDDKLYKIKVTLTFSKTKFEQCMANYNTLAEVFKNYFLDWEDFITSSEATKEQTGEGYWFYPTSEAKRNTEKIERLSLGYNVEYEMKWSDSRQNWYKTGNVDTYVIEIEYINLKGTKLTNQEF